LFFVKNRRILKEKEKRKSPCFSFLREIWDKRNEKDLFSCYFFKIETNFCFSFPDFFFVLKNGIFFLVFLPELEQSARSSICF
jgi:hypothetical protein